MKIKLKKKFEFFKILYEVTVYIQLSYILNLNIKNITICHKSNLF